MRYIAATSGSDRKGTIFGWAWVLADETGRVIGSKYGCSLISNSWTHAWSIAAECTAVIDLLTGLKEDVEIHIVHKDEGPGRWARGEWKASKPCAKGYCAHLLKLGHSVKFILAHECADHKLSEIASNLARKALDEQPVRPVFEKNTDL